MDPSRDYPRQFNDLLREYNLHWSKYGVIAAKNVVAMTDVAAGKGAIPPEGDFVEEERLWRKCHELLVQIERVVRTSRSQIG